MEIQSRATKYVILAAAACVSASGRIREATTGPWVPAIQPACTPVTGQAGRRKAAGLSVLVRL